MIQPPSKPVCEKCQGTLVPDQEVDLLTGMSLVVYRCVNCGRRSRLGNEPRPLTSKVIESKDSETPNQKPNT